MNKETREILNIIKSGVTKEEIEISNEILINNMIELANKHSIFTLIYYGLHNCNVSVNDNLKTQLSNIAIREMYVSEQQLYYIREISRRFDKNNIDYMLLKGGVLKHLYPQAEIRHMGDIDILIKEKQYSKIIKVLEELGFAFKYESNHEIVWGKNSILIELHKILMPSYNKDLHEYFGNGWARAIKSKGSSYIFSDNDMFVYTFSHFAKHYRDAGIGVTHMCDLFVLLRSCNLDFGYIDEELKKLHLYEFWCNVKATLDAWFLDGESTEMTEHITTVVFNSGTYGLKEKSNISLALKSKKANGNLMSGKIKRITKAIFPSYDSMQRRYRVLKVFSWLLPFFWMWRWFELMFFRPQKIKKELKNISSISDRDVEEYQRQLNYVGLDYHF